MKIFHEKKVLSSFKIDITVFTYNKTEYVVFDNEFQHKRAFVEVYLKLAPNLN